MGSTMTDNLAADFRRLLQDQPAIARLGRLDPDRIYTVAEALAAALACLVPDPLARAELQALAERVFANATPARPRWLTCAPRPSATLPPGAWPRRCFLRTGFMACWPIVFPERCGWTGGNRWRLRSRPCSRGSCPSTSHHGPGWGGGSGWIMAMAQSSGPRRNWEMMSASGMVSPWGRT